MTTFNQNTFSTLDSVQSNARATVAKEKLDACMKMLKEQYGSYKCVTVQAEPFRVDLLISPFDRSKAAILTDGGMLEGQMLLCNKMSLNLMNWTQFSAYSDYFPGLDARISAMAKEYGITTAVVHRVTGRDEWLTIPGLECMTHWEFMTRYAPGRSWMIGWPCVLVDLKYHNGYENPSACLGAQFHL